METIVKGTNKSLVLGYQDLKIKKLEATLSQRIKKGLET